MAKKGKSDNYDALGSIFDFMFEESRKAPDKRRPKKIDPTKLAGDSMLVDAIAASLEKPGFFVSDTVVDELNGALEIELSVTPYSGVGKLKVTSNNLIDLIRDPEKFVSKSVATTKAIRKSMRAKFAGQAMTDLVNAAWARKYGDLEAQSMVIATGASRRLEGELRKDRGYKVSSAIGQMAGGRSTDTDKHLMADRAAELIARRTFSNWEEIAEGSDKREDFLNLISYVSTYDEGELRNKFDGYIAKHYRGVSADEANKAFERLTKAYGGGLFDAKNYRKLEVAELQSKIKPLEDLENNKTITATDAEKLDVYRKTRMLIEGKSNLLSEMEEIRKELAKSGITGDQKRILERKLNDGRLALRRLDGETFFGEIGKYEGWYNSLKTVWTGGNLATSILSGDFYNKNKNSFFLPIAEEKMVSREKDVKLEFFTAAKSDNILINKYNKVMTNVYYLTPRSIFRTIFYNGEGFAYMMSNRMNGIESLLRAKGIAEDDPLLKDIIGVFKNQSGEDFKTGLESQLLLLSQVLDPDTFSKIQGLAKAAGKFKNLAENFSVLYKIQSSITGAIAKHTLKIRAKIAKTLLSSPKMKAWFAKNAAGKLLGQWVATGGIDVLVKSAITAIATALGTTMGPVGNAIAFVVSSIVTDVALKLLGVTLNIIKYLALGVIAMFIIVGVFASAGLKKSFKLISKAYLTPPAKVQQCTLYEEMELEEGETYPWGDVIMPPPSGEECLFGTGTFYCSQGYVDVTGGSHQNYTQNLPVDLTQVSSINAPQFCDKGAGNCTITRVAKIKCKDNKDAGGIVEMDATYNGVTYHFKFLHVGTSLSVGSKLGPGDPVAVVQDNFEKGLCWTGKHLHLEIKQNGSSVDPLEVMQAFGCNLPDETGCKNPPF